MRQRKENSNRMQVGEQRTLGSAWSLEKREQYKTNGQGVYSANKNGRF